MAGPPCGSTLAIKVVCALCVLAALATGTCAGKCVPQTLPCTLLSAAYTCQHAGTTASVAGPVVTYVSGSSGRDSGNNCTIAAAPCASLGHAVQACVNLTNTTAPQSRSRALAGGPTSGASQGSSDAAACTVTVLRESGPLSQTPVTVSGMVPGLLSIAAETPTTVVCTVSGGGGYLDFALAYGLSGPVPGSALAVSGLTFTGCGGALAVDTSTSFAVRHVTVHNVSGPGLYVLGGPLTVEDSTFTHVRGAGVKLYFTGPVLVERCVFTASWIGVMVGPSDTVVVRNSSFVGTGAVMPAWMGGAVGVKAGDGESWCTTVVVGCHFGTGLGTAVAVPGPANVTVLGNSFTSTLPNHVPALHVTNKGILSVRGNTFTVAGSGHAATAGASINASNFVVYQAGCAQPRGGWCAAVVANNTWRGASDGVVPVGSSPVTMNGVQPSVFNVQRQGGSANFTVTVADACGRRVVWSDGVFPYGGGLSCGGYSAGVSVSWPAVPRLGLLAGVAHGNWYSIAQSGGAQLVFKPQFSVASPVTASTRRAVLASANVTLSVQTQWPLPPVTFDVEVHVE